MQNGELKALKHHQVESSVVETELPIEAINDRTQ